MAKRSNPERPSSAPAASPEPTVAPSPSSLACLAALGVASALWALFLWGELVLARRGGTPFCALGTGTDCTALWDSSFASAVHGFTGLPVAAWGLVWGLTAFVLPLLALLRVANGRPGPFLVCAIRLQAAAGAMAVFALLAVAALERAFCLGCFVSYLLIAGYAGIALLGWPRAGCPEPARGAAAAASATAAAFLLLVYPGLRTPRGAAAAGREALAGLERGGMSRVSPVGGDAASTGDPERDRMLQELVTSLQPDLRQALADSLHIYRASPVLSLPPPRSLLGSPEAPVRITEFTDVLCTHCAELHQTLESLRRSLPEGSFNVESRQFPLDAECNPLMRGRSDPVRCLAAKVKLCLGGQREAGQLTGVLFERQKGLTPEQVFALAAPYMPRRALETCVASPATREQLAEDIELASRTHADGTPIVLVNGRRGTSFGPFLYAMVLTRGSPENPAFVALPPANPSAHLH